jgi:hypothetical protein
MIAATYDISLEQGTDWSITITLTGLPSLSGYSAKSQIRTGAGGTIVATPTVTISDPINNVIIMSLTSAQTSAIPITKGNSAISLTYKDIAKFTYDLVITSPENITTRILNGMVYVSPEVTE